MLHCSLGLSTQYYLYWKGIFCRTQSIRLKIPLWQTLFRNDRHRTCWEVGHVWQNTIDEWGYIHKLTYHTMHCNWSMDMHLTDMTECHLVNSEYLAQLHPECLQSSSIEQSWCFWFQWYIILHWLIRNWQRYTFKWLLMAMPARLGNLGARCAPMKCEKQPILPDLGNCILTLAHIVLIKNI